MILKYIEKNWEEQVIKHEKKVEQLKERLGKISNQYEAEVTAVIEHVQQWEAELWKKPGGTETRKKRGWNQGPRRKSHPLQRKGERQQKESPEKNPSTNSEEKKTQSQTELQKQDDDLGRCVRRKESEEMVGGP